MFDLGELRTSLTALAMRSRSEAELIDLISDLERLKSAAAALQARATAELAHQRWAREAERGVPAKQRCQGLASEIALARRTSPHRGARDLGLAKALVEELPGTLAALERGDISEWRATLVARETAALSREHRGEIDERLAGRLAGMGDREAAAAARALGYELDPGSALRRSRTAATDRYVSLRPAPDTMTYLTGFLPVAQGVACQAALEREADTLRARGDIRTRGQIMADTLVERVTGQARADRVPVEVELVITDTSLLAGEDSPARLRDYGPIPAAVARTLVREADRAWVRRLYTRPQDEALVSCDSRRRVFSGGLRRLVILRDEICRTPWCDAPVRHVDHVVRAADGGTTEVENSQGLCETCNYTKEASGWRASRLPGSRHRLEISTPTGHTFVSEPSRQEPRSRLAQRLRRISAA